MTRLSEIFHWQVQTESGETLGRVLEVSAGKAPGGWVVVDLLTGHRGLLARLGLPRGAGGKPRWTKVLRIQDNIIVVRDGS